MYERQLVVLELAILELVILKLVILKLVVLQFIQHACGRVYRNSVTIDTAKFCIFTL